MIPHIAKIGNRCYNFNHHGTLVDKERRSQCFDVLRISQWLHRRIACRKTFGTFAEAGTLAHYGRGNEKINDWRFGQTGGAFGNEGCGTPKILGPCEAFQ